MKNKIHLTALGFMLLWMTGAESDNFATWSLIMCIIMAIAFLTLPKTKESTQ